MTDPRGNVQIDVAVPSYGSPRHLAQAIESVLAQDLRDFRLRVFANGPGDAADTASRYLDDERVEIVASESVLSLRENWNRAIRAGDAPYVAMLHDDDWWHDGFLRRRVEFMDAHPDCGFVFSSMFDVDGEGEVVSAIPHPLAEGVHSPREFVPLLLERMVVGSPTPLVRRSAYEAAGAEFTDRVINVDWDMWLRIALRGPVGYLAVRDCSRRVHAGSQTAATRGWGEEQINLAARFEELVERELPSLDWPESTRRWRRADGHLMCALDAVEDGDRRMAVRRLRSAVGAHRRTLLDPRVALAAGSLCLPRRGPALVAWARERRRAQRATVAAG